MNLLLSIDVPSVVKRSLYDQFEPLRMEYPYMKWVPYQFYHIPLFNFGSKFTGEAVRRAVDSVVYDIDAYPIYTNENGLLMRHSLSLYVGFQKSYPTLRIVKEIKEQLGINDGLTFFPHLTVAEYRIPSKQQYLLLKKKFLRIIPDAEFEVTQITLYESVIENKMPKYIPLETFQLPSA